MVLGALPMAIFIKARVFSDLFFISQCDSKGTFLSTHMIDSIDMLWDRTLIMQGGSLRANVTREELAARGEALEELFFAITEGKEQVEEA